MADEVKDNVEQQEEPSQQTSMQAQTSPSSTSAGPDSDVASVDEVPDVDKDEDDAVAAGKIAGDLGVKVTAGANYVGSLFSSAWTKTAKTANDATANSTSFLTSALSKVNSAGMASEHDDENGGEKKTAEAKNGESVDESKAEEKETASHATLTAASSLFSSAMSGFGFASGKSDQPTGETKPAEAATEEAAAAEHAEANKAFAGFSLTALTKAATDATQSIKEKVVTGNHMLAEFNKEQESFIKSKTGFAGEVGVAPWVGYQGEDELKVKILALSEDKRNFVRAPPSGVSFEFEYSSVSSTALALLQEDPKLEKMRYALVPKTVKEEEFWRNYFYRVSLIKQSFELKDLEQEQEKKADKDKKKTNDIKKAKDKAEDNTEAEAINDNDDEFVSDSYQASTSDIKEVDESMKKLGEWEAELEGELNEFEVVDGEKDEHNPEWESQIQEMLDAEEKSSSNK